MIEDVASTLARKIEIAVIREAEHGGGVGGGLEADGQGALERKPIDGHHVELAGEALLPRGACSLEAYAGLAPLFEGLGLPERDDVLEAGL